ncbi:acyl carrier protein-like protein [Kockiozyma suomiensis]|uniref:acyl carrier protein-like protein n=1 Tax=Kockiozyma suomiensis TaxID=1337062 RepID=UPI0033434F2D
MLRSSIFRSAPAALRRAVSLTAVASPKIAAARPLASRLAAPALPARFARFYSADAGLSRDEVQARILEVVKSFDKVTDPSKITSEASFAADLGLDSLDTVEVVMAIEEEFSIEIPDKEADEIKSVGQAIDYILAQSDGMFLFVL